METSLSLLYKNKISQELLKKFQYKNIHEIPKLVKITLNRGLGETAQNAKSLEYSIKEFSLITGQKPIINKAKKSIAGFKIRENIPIGLSVTLRKEKMYNFLNKLINLSLPRIRDFRGINVKQFDGRGNYNLGIKEQLIFPEIEYDQIDKIRGMDIAIVTTAKTDEESLALLEGFGMPFKKIKIIHLNSIGQKIIMIHDTIADMLTRIRNANLAKHQIVQVPATKMTRNILKVLQEEGFIYQFEEIGENFKSFLIISLKYKGKSKKPVITELKRISKPGLRVYANHKDLPKVLGGIGIAIISTSQGVMTDRHARHNGLGGEVLCYIW